MTKKYQSPFINEKLPMVFALNVEVRLYFGLEDMAVFMDVPIILNVNLLSNFKGTVLIINSPYVKHSGAQKRGFVHYK